MLVCFLLKKRGGGPEEIGNMTPGKQRHEGQNQPLKNTGFLTTCYAYLIKVKG